MRISFSPFVLDLGTRQLLRGGREVHLSPKAFELLAMLTAARPSVLPKDVLQQRLWPETFVAEANLANLIAEIRRALQDRTRPPQFVRTAHGFGYAFCADATIEPDTSHQSTAPPGCWLEWGSKRFPLSTGEHVVGRDEDVPIRLDATTVSRRHACFVVTDEGTLLQDFDSKNGTFRGNDRVTSPVRLTDGDDVRIGSVLLTFRERSRSGSTDTLVPSIA